MPLATGSRDPGAMTTADVNGDGKVDLVVARRSSLSGSVLVGAMLNVLLANGDGTCQPNIESPTDADLNTALLVVADLNGDGWPDAVVNDEGGTPVHSRGLRVVLGRGDGTFQPSVLYAMSSSPRAIAVADVTGDGTPDIVAMAGSIGAGQKWVHSRRWVGSSAVDVHRRTRAASRARGGLRWWRRACSDRSSRISSPGRRDQLIGVCRPERDATVARGAVALRG